MIDLNRKQVYLEDEDITLEFAESLIDSGVYVDYMGSPVKTLKTGEEDIIINTKTDKFEDLEYAKEAIVESKPLILFLYKVKRTYGKDGISYLIKYNYILNEESILNRG